MSSSSSSSSNTPAFKEVPHVDVYNRDAARRDPAAFWRSKEQLTREKWIALAEFKLLQERLGQCYFNAGVNHFVECKPLVEEYARRLANPDFADPINGVAKLGQKSIDQHI